MKNNILKIIIITLTLNSAAGFGWWWLYNQIKKESKNIGVLNNDVATAAAKQRNIKTLEQTLKSIEEKKLKIDSSFTDEKGIVRFIENIEELAAFSGVNLEISSASLPLKTEEGGPSFNLIINGGFGRLFKFFSLLDPP